MGFESKFRMTLEELLRKAREKAKEKTRIPRPILEAIKREWYEAFENSEGDPIVRVHGYYCILAKPSPYGNIVEVPDGRKGYPILIGGSEDARVMCFFDSDEVFEKFAEALKTGEYVILVTARKPKPASPVNAQAVILLREIEHAR